jgi:hypothetical protein
VQGIEKSETYGSRGQRSDSDQQAEAADRHERRAGALQKGKEDAGEAYRPESLFRRIIE